MLRPQELVQSKIVRIEPRAKFQMRMKINTKSGGAKFGDQIRECGGKNLEAGRFTTIEEKQTFLNPQDSSGWST